MNAKPTFIRHLMATRLQLLRVLPALLGLGYSLPVAAATTLPEQLIGITQAFLEQAVTTHLERSEIQARHGIEIQQIDKQIQQAMTCFKSEKVNSSKKHGFWKNP